jgi:multidrug efflux pump subunit AcrB
MQNGELGQPSRGPIAYMASNGVAANLLMLLIVAAGLISTTGLVQEAFPVLEFDAVEIVVPYPGATPDEVERSIVAKIEEQVESLDGAREVASVAAEGVASVIVRLRAGTDISRALDDIESAVNHIRTFPAGADRVEIRKMTNRQSVIRLVLYGDVAERTLKELAYDVEGQLASLPAVSAVRTDGVRPYEISIEVPQHRLRALGLTLNDVASAVRAGSLDLSAGSIATLETQVRLRTIGRRYGQQDFEELIVLSRSDGTIVRLADIATVRDGFREVDLVARHQGQRAAFVDVYRSAGEPVLAVAEAVEAHVQEHVIPSLPQGVHLATWHNDAEIYESRLSLLLENGFLGLVLVLVALALFLEIRLAIWVVVGIAVSFVGALTAALVLNVSINTTSLFAFILAVGIVVDDAIVTAEHIHAERRRGLPGTVAAIRGTRRIAKPLVFAVLTTIAAFAPLLFLPGPIGKLAAAIPIVLIAILILSLVESLLVLPNHLSHLPGPDRKPTNPVERWFSALNAHVDRQLERFVEGHLDRGLRFATRQPAIVLAAGVAGIVLCIALIPAGIIDVSFAPSAQSDTVTARLEMPVGTPARKTDEFASAVEAAGYRAIERLAAGRPPDAPSLLAGVNRTIGVKPHLYGGSATEEAGLPPPAHIAVVELKLIESERRAIGANELVEAWRDEVGPAPDAGTVTITAELLDFGAPIHVELSHPDADRLRVISEAVAERVRRFDGVFEVRSDSARGLREVLIELQPEGRTLGLTVDDLARQTRSAFFGEEAVRVQRAKEEVRVYVRLPTAERDAITDLGRYMVRTPAGHVVPLGSVASTRLATSPPSIRRKNGRRVVAVTAEVDAGVVASGAVIAELENAILPRLASRNPGLTWAFGGQQQLQTESLGALAGGFALALLAIYGLLAVPLRSYAKPLITMAVIPFGVVGALLGHLIMGIGLTAASIWGILGLGGVVVNDSLMMIDFIGGRMRQGQSPCGAIVDGAKARFRPIFLTSLTTFLGFTPLIFENSPQAQLLVPLAVSLGFGVVFATAILMMVIPALCGIYYGVAAGATAPDPARQRSDGD